MRIKISIFLIYFLSLPNILLAQNSQESLQLKPNKEFLLKKQPVIHPFNEGISSLREEIEILRKELTALAQYVERKDEKITALTNQLIELSLKLSEKEQLLEENGQQLTALSAQLTDIQSRLELGERIIEEKDKEIQSLAAGKPLEHNQEVLAQDTGEDLRPLLKMYQQKLKEANHLIQEKIAQLNTLNNDLASWQAKFRKEELSSQSKNKEIAAIKRTIDQLRWQAMDADSHLKNQLSSKDKELYELQGVLKIYQQKLKQVNSLIRDKISVLDELMGLDKGLN